MTDDEIIVKAIEIIEREVIGEGCKTPDYEDFADDPETRITPDINDPARCYACAAKQVVVWLRDYLALAEPLERKV